MDFVRLALQLGNDRKGHGNCGPFAVSPGDEVLIGRQAVNGLVTEGEWTPRVLARLVPAGDVWLLVNGPSGDVEVRNSAVKVTRRARELGKGETRRRKTVDVGAIFVKNAVIALPPGRTEAEWHIFNDNIRLSLVVGGDVDGLEKLQPEDTPFRGASASRFLSQFGRRKESSTEADSRIQRVAQGDARTAPGRRATARIKPERFGTHFPEGNLLTRRQRQVMATVFRHLLIDEPRPRDLAKAAAEQLGMTVDGVKKHVRDVKKKVNAERDGWDLTSIDELGEWLVKKTRFVTSGDLQPVEISTLDAALKRARRPQSQGQPGPPGDHSK